MGAEDYIVKPFEILELLARVEVVLRRYNKSQRVIEYKDIAVDTVGMTVKKDGQAVGLTPKEFDLAVLFMRNRNITLSRERLFELVWGGEYDTDTRNAGFTYSENTQETGLGSVPENNSQDWVPTGVKK